LLGLINPSAPGRELDKFTAYFLPFTDEAGAKDPFKRQLHASNVVAVGWEPQAVLPLYGYGENGEVDQPFTDRCAPNMLFVFGGH